AHTKFFVADQSAHGIFDYSSSGGFQSESDIASNIRSRGIAANAAGTMLWVIGADKKVYVFKTNGTPLGSWSAGDLNQPQDITVFGNDIWIVDRASGKVFRYANAASRLSGSQNPTQSFALDCGNSHPSGIVTNGTNIWVTDDSNHSDEDESRGKEED